MSYFKTARFFLYLTPLVVILVTTSTLFPFIVGKYVSFRFLVGLSFIFLVLGIIFGRESRKYWRRLVNAVKSPLGIVIGIFTATFLLACVFGFDPAHSFWSNFERGEGGLQIIFLYLFFISLLTLFEKEKNWRKFLWIFLLSAMLMILYGVGAGLKYIDAETTTQIVGGVEQTFFTGSGGPFYTLFHNFIGPSFSESGFRFQGSFGNPAYVATYLIFAMFFAGYLLVSKFRETNKLKKIVLISFIAVFLVFFFLAGTRGAFLGLGAGVFAGLLYLGLSKESWRKPALGILIALVVLGSLGIVFKNTKFVNSIPGSRVFDISLKTKTFQHRMIMWGVALEGWKEKPVFGWGPENYNEIFYRHFPPKYYEPSSGDYGAWFDRAHSVIFDYLAETGAVGLLAYLSMFVVFFWQLAKVKVEDSKWSNVLKTLFIAIPIAYLVQSLAFFEILVIYIALYVFFALGQYKLGYKQRETVNKEAN